MPRNVRVVSRKRKRPTKWCAESLSFDIPASGSIVVGDGQALCDNTVATQDVPDPLVGWCRGQISVSRNGTGTVTPAVAWAIVMMRVNPGFETALQTFDPWLKEDLERQDILGMGHCAVPPTVLIPSSDANVANRSSSVTDIHVKVSRRFLRNTNMLMLWVISKAGDGEFHAETTIRSLMKFG